MIRLILFAVLPAGLLGIAAAAVVWLPGAADLSMPRLLAGGAVWMAVQATGSWVLGHYVGRRWGQV
ncbi:hypothetical protein ACFYY1_37095 [Streptomyces sp. NPDC001890]|uniref:hypothetical protein n=1 Tax=Streptomyces sp. NPDC001890 TaxID=3364620 RepID=UPI0036C332F3